MEAGLKEKDANRINGEHAQLRGQLASLEQSKKSLEVRVIG